MYRSAEWFRLQPKDVSQPLGNSGGYGYGGNGDYLYDEATGPNRPRRRPIRNEWEESPEIQAVIERVAAEQQVVCNVSYWGSHQAELAAQLPVFKPDNPFTGRRRVDMAKP